MSKNWEQLIEDAFIATLTTAGLPSPRRWKDASKSEVYPCAIVHCSPVPPANEAHTDEIIEATVELGARTRVMAKTGADPDGSQCRSLLGQIRTAVFDTGILATLSTADLKFISLDVGGGDDGSADNLNTASVPVTCNIQTLT